MSTEQIPSHSDWEGYEESLDARSAYDSFFEKSNNDVQPFFFNNVIEATDELRFMPDIPFRYYISGFVQYINAGKFKPYEASDAANCFLNLIRYKLEHSPRLMFDLIKTLLPIAEYISLNQNKFEAPEEVYGDFKETYNQIKRLAEAYAPAG